MYINIYIALHSSNSGMWINGTLVDARYQALSAIHENWWSGKDKKDHYRRFLESLYKTIEVKILLGEKLILTCILIP